MASALAAIALLCAAILPAAAQAPMPAPAADPAPAPAGGGDPHSLGLPKDPGTSPVKPKEQTIDEMMKLKDSKDEPQFAKLLEKAKSLGASEEELLEAEITYCFRAQMWDKLKEVHTRFAALVPRWNLEKAGYIRTAGQPEAMNELIKAVVAAEGGDMKGFETAIKEAIWLNPEEANFYAQFILGYRRKARMTSIAVPMNAKFATSQGGTATFAELVKGKKVLLLNFWTGFTPESLAGITEMVDVEKELGPQGVVSVGLNIEGNAAAAEEARKENKITFPWLLEEKTRALYNQMGSTTFPLSALVTPEGKVLYIGDPRGDDIGLHEALAKLGITYKLPTDDLPPSP
ncbi:hypothetical protein DB346_08815 [Verrucomicrobia bacterium LW23]|nr:hypothetical protein DB346_08815 [Verrucomicrobia bacterium LW23]